LGNNDIENDSFFKVFSAHVEDLHIRFNVNIRSKPSHKFWHLTRSTFYIEAGLLVSVSCNFKVSANTACASNVYTYSATAEIAAFSISGILDVGPII
jgi:chromosome condensin MukBEF MukE localization factor